MIERSVSRRSWRAAAIRSRMKYCEGASPVERLNCRVKCASPTRRPHGHRDPDRTPSPGSAASAPSPGAGDRPGWRCGGGPRCVQDPDSVAPDGSIPPARCFPAAGCSAAAARDLVGQGLDQPTKARASRTPETSRSTGRPAHAMDLLHRALQQRAAEIEMHHLERRRVTATPA